MKPYYEDDLVTLFHGNCLESNEWLQADVLITDPPYGIKWKTNGTKRSTVKQANIRPHAGIRNDMDTSYRDKVLELWGDKPGAVFGSWRASFPDNSQILVWRKPVDAGVVGSVTGFRTDTELIFLTGRWPKRDSQWSSVITTDTGMHSYLNGHPHAKPVPVMQRLVVATDGMIADPFAGRGATLVAAASLGRKIIGFELEEKHCEYAANRLSQQTFDIGALA